MASFAVHAAVLAALSLMPIPLNATPLDAEEPSSGDPLFVHAEETRPAFPRRDQNWSWFDAIGPFVLEPPEREEQDLPPSDTPECAAGPHDGWTQFDPREFGIDDRYSASHLIASAVNECASQAAQGGWPGRGRVFVRVNRRDDGAASATTTALGPDAHSDALLCCLRQAQAPVASLLGPGAAARFVLVFSTDPVHRHIRVEHPAASRRGGGARALAAVQSAFTE